jgi:hypothetical protein
MEPATVGAVQEILLKFVALSVAFPVVVLNAAVGALMPPWASMLVTW